MICSTKVLHSRFSHFRIENTYNKETVGVGGGKAPVQEALF